MDFAIPDEIEKDRKRFLAFLATHLTPHLAEWYKEGAIPRQFFEELGSDGWLGFENSNNGLNEQSILKQAVFAEELAKLSPGVTVAVLVQISLGTKGLWLFGSQQQKLRYLDAAALGKTLVCLGNTELKAGTDVANVEMRAEKVNGGWLLNGAKSYVTNGFVSDLTLVTAVTDPDAQRNSRLSMFIVDLSAPGVTRTKLHKQVWIPSDLTRLRFENVLVPEENLLGTRGRGLQQVLSIFTHSRISISALTLGTAVGAFQTGLDHAKRRTIFGKKLIEFQAKAFEFADFFAKIEAARLVLWKACWTKEQGGDFRLEASLAKYLTVQIAREVGLWAADLFGAASVMFEHPIHKYPMDAWASSLGEGTQDVQKLVIFRELIRD